MAFSYDVRSALHSYTIREITFISKSNVFIWFSVLPVLRELIFSIPEILKNSIFEIPVILQTLDINN